MTKGKQWKAEELPVDSIIMHKDFQFRVDGINAANLNRIVQALEAGGETRDPVEVARVGKNL